MGLYGRYFKRPLDIICSLMALIILSPVILGTALLVRIKLGYPVLFTQERPGKGEKNFKMYKFRSMTDERDDNGNLLPDSQRLSKFGQTLRATSLDELPELWNIFIGDMSFVGPRPLLERYLLYYTDKERTRHKVRPGLTGLAQVNGRNTLNWDDRLFLDSNYVENLSISLDIRIVFKTVKKVIGKEDVLVKDKAPLQDLDIERGKENANKANYL